MKVSSGITSPSLRLLYPSFHCPCLVLTHTTRQQLSLVMPSFDPHNQTIVFSCRTEIEMYLICSCPNKWKFLFHNNYSLHFKTGCYVIFHPGMVCHFYFCYLTRFGSYNLLDFSFCSSSHQHTYPLLP